MKKKNKKKKYLKDAGDCEEEIRMLHEENEERQVRFQARFQTLSEKSGEEEIQALQAVEERSGSCASQSNGCCFNPAVVEHFLTLGAAQAMQQLNFVHGEICRVFGGQYQTVPTAEEHLAEEKEKEELEGVWDKEKAANDWYESATVDPAVNLVWCQNASGGSLGEKRIPGTPRTWKAGS